MKANLLQNPRDQSSLYTACNPAQAARLAGEQVEQAVKGAEEGFKEGNTLEATAKAAIAAWRASQVGLPPAPRGTLLGVY